jgi:hypothetical protein
MRDVSKFHVAALGGILVALLALASCGGSSHSANATPATTTPTTTAGGRGGGFAALRTCLQNHGITLATQPRRGGPPSTTPGETRPSGGGFFGGGGGGGGRGLTPPPGVSESKFQAAIDACRSSLPNGGNRLNSSAFAAYRSCLSDHGVTLPTAGSTPATGSTPPPTINRNDPKVAAAMKACAALLPQGFGRNTTTTTPGA